MTGTESMEKQRLTRLAGLGSFGAAAAHLALYGLIIYITRPTPTGGMNASMATLTWLALGGVFGALIAAHVLYGRVLLSYATRTRA
jgi:hypothetical protein